MIICKMSSKRIKKTLSSLHDLPRVGQSVPGFRFVAEGVASAVVPEESICLERPFNYAIVNQPPWPGSSAPPFWSQKRVSTFYLF